MSKFKLGQTVMTVGISERMQKDNRFTDFVFASLRRYCDEYWGDVCEEDRTLNDWASKHDERVHAAYVYPETKERILIITEWDRSVTTILFPSEY